LTDIAAALYHRGVQPRTIWLAIRLVSGLGVLAWASEVVAAQPEVEADPPADPLDELRERYEEARVKYDLGDFLGAIELWTDLYQNAPTEYRKDLQNSLANAHIRQYEFDRDLQHLRQAKILLQDYLDSLDPNDTDTRTNAQTRIDEATAEIERVETLEAERQRDLEAAVLAERQAAEREAALEDASHDLHAGRQRRDKILKGVGGTGLGVGSAALVVMGVGLGLGAKAEADGRARIAEDPLTPAIELQELVQQGRSYNSVAIATAVAGGVLVVSGAAMLIVAATSRKRASARARLHPRFGPHLELGVLRF
jgi:tetratricopeptide (TPR) repeat protein